jgi:hypothetical protein
MASLVRQGKTVGGGQHHDLLAEPIVEHQTPIEGGSALVPKGGGGPVNELDGEKARDTHRKLMSWYYYERDRQATNRMEMAIDHDFYDGDQWSEDDKKILEDNNQAPLVYNEVAPMTDWMIGTERRTRVDWKVLPRAEDDVEKADVKTKVLKYVSDVNAVPQQRSRAFADAMKGGIGWVDDGVRDDPSKDAIYSRYEDWRNVIMDSAGLDLLGEDARYLFRWRHVDEDIAVMMFPKRADKITAAVDDWAQGAIAEDDDLAGWESPLNGSTVRKGTISPYVNTAVGYGAERRRVRLIEAQWREPTPTKFVTNGPLAGSIFDPRDSSMKWALENYPETPQIIDKVIMRVHVAVMTETHMLAMGPSIYRHNQFSLTPIVCYRRSRDRQWYGPIRRVRDIQRDLNKRASKSLWYLNGNQLVAEEGAFKDVQQAKEEAADPNGVIQYKKGYNFDIRRDAEAATGHMQFMALDQQSIQRSGGVPDENLGRKTNAISGEAIKARQQQGSVVMTEPFDNLRFAVQHQGQKQLSLVEQFYSEKKVIRLTGATGPIEWVKINVPEEQPDGSIRYLNDITDSMADFIVSEADYAGTLRQVMFDSLTQMSQRMPPELAVRMLRIAFEYSDLPNKREIVDEIRRMTGEQDPAKKLTPEEQAAAEKQQAMQDEAAQLQRESAITALEEQRAKVRQINAQADKLEAEARAAGMGADGSGPDAAAIEGMVAQIRAEAQDQIEALSQRLAKATASNEAAIYKANKAADSAAEVARIQAANKLAIAEATKPAEDALAELQKRLASVESATKPKSKPAAKK